MTENDTDHTPTIDLDETETAEHLTPVYTGRGFARLPAIQGSPGDSVRVYESSAAEGPHLWLAVGSPTDRNKPDGPAFEAHAHLPVDQARKVAEQILQLCDRHYQL